MRKILLLAAGLILIPLPAFSQMMRDSDRDRDRDRDSSRREIEEMLRGIDGDTFRAGRRSAGFLLRSGDSTIAVRCDPRDSMKSCVDATLTLLEKARSMMPTGGGGGGAAGGGGGPGGGAPGGPPR